MPKLQLTAEEIEEYLELEKQRKELESQSRAIARRTKALSQHFRAFLEQQDKRSLVRQGYRLSLIEGSPRVAWKDAYIDLAGPLAADELQKEAPRPDKLTVEKA